MTANSVTLLATAAVLGAVWRHDRGKAHALLWAGLPLFSSVGWMLLTLPEPADLALSWALAACADVAMAAAAFLFLLGTARYVGRPCDARMWGLAALAGVASGLVAMAWEMPFLREVANAAVFLLLMLPSLVLLVRYGRGNTAECGMLTGVLVAVALDSLYGALALVQAPSSTFTLTYFGFDVVMIGMPMACVLMGLSGVLAICLQLVEDVETLARTDALTGVLNRRGFATAAALELARARRLGQPLSIISVDLDHFKSINDTYGHGVGDMTLKACADVLRGNLREMDVIARLGGEEFVVLLAGIDGAAAWEVAERMRLSLHACVLPGLQGRRLTASFGVAALTQPDGTVDDLLQRSDTAMYQAKSQGRDRVVALQEV